MAGRRLAVVVAVLLALAALAGCRRPPTSSADDPGGRRVRALHDDPAADLAPPGAERVDDGARVALDGLPSVVWREYRWRRPLAAAFAFYRRQLPRRDWRFLQERALPASDGGFPGATVAEFEKDMGGWTALLVVERREGEGGASGWC